jgi:hypothetical protein
MNSTPARYGLYNSTICSSISTPLRPDRPFYARKTPLRAALGDFVGWIRQRERAANDVIGHFLKRRELVDVVERIERIEEPLAELIGSCHRGCTLWPVRL